MIRPCLGVDLAAPGFSPRDRGFSLRDLELSREQLVAVGVSPHAVAGQMGEALAFLLWSARLDGGGVDFVLAPGRAQGWLRHRVERRPRGVAVTPDVLGPRVALWMLDFDECGSMAADGEEVERAVRAFLGSGRDGRPAFFPMPPASDRREGDSVWAAFRNAFMSKSLRTVKNVIALEFVEMVERLVAGPGEELEMFMESSR